MNKIYFIQTLTETGKRHCYLVSSPCLDNAVIEIHDAWCDDDEEIITAEAVEKVYDTDDNNIGKVVVKVHN